METTYAMLGVNEYVHVELVNWNNVLVGREVIANVYNLYKSVQSLHCMSYVNY